MRRRRGKKGKWTIIELVAISHRDSACSMHSEVHCAGKSLESDGLKLELETQNFQRNVQAYVFDHLGMATTTLYPKTSAMILGFPL